MSRRLWNRKHKRNGLAFRNKTQAHSQENTISPEIFNANYCRGNPQQWMGLEKCAPRSSGECNSEIMCVLFRGETNIFIKSCPGGGGPQRSGVQNMHSF